MKLALFAAAVCVAASCATAQAAYILPSSAIYEHLDCDNTPGAACGISPRTEGTSACLTPDAEDSCYVFEGEDCQDPEAPMSSEHRCWQSTLEKALAICNRHSECYGITRDNGGYEPRRKGGDPVHAHPASHELWTKPSSAFYQHLNCESNPGAACGISPKTDETCLSPDAGDNCWVFDDEDCIDPKAPMQSEYRCWQSTLEAAIAICDRHASCYGITRDNGGFEPRRLGNNTKPYHHSSSHELFTKLMPMGRVVAPTVEPTVSPTTAPTVSPSKSPSVAPTESPTLAPTSSPTPRLACPEEIAFDICASIKPSFCHWESNGGATHCTKCGDGSCRPGKDEAICDDSSLYDHCSAAPTAMPTTKAPATKAPTTKAPTTKSPTKSPTAKAPSTSKQPTSVPTIQIPELACLIEFEKCAGMLLPYVQTSIYTLSCDQYEILSECAVQSACTSLVENFSDGLDSHYCESSTNKFIIIGGAVFAVFASIAAVVLFRRTKSNKGEIPMPHKAPLPPKDAPRSKDEIFIV